MNEFKALFSLNMKKRIKDSFLIGYGVIFPLMMIAILGYMSSNYYDNSSGVSSYYYYTMVIIPFCTFLGSVTLIYYAREESLYKCGERYIIAPISKSMVVLSKILPSTIAMSVYNLILLLICKFVFKVNFNGKSIEIFILLVVLSFLSCAIGTFIGVCSKDFLTVKNIVSIPIMIMALLGGSFFQISSLGKVFEKISLLSPLTYVNRGIFMMLNDNSYRFYIIALIVITTLGLLFTLASIRYFKEEVYL